MSVTLAVAALTAVPLPSHRAAAMLIAGEPGGLPLVIGSTVLRGAIIAAGLYAVDRKRKRIARDAMAGALAIEAFVLLWTAFHRPTAIDSGQGES